MTNLYNQEMREYIMTEHNAELINKDQPSMEDVITTNAGEDMIKEYGVDEVTNPTRKVLMKTTSNCDPISFATLDRWSSIDSGDSTENYAVRKDSDMPT